MYSEKQSLPQAPRDFMVRYRLNGHLSRKSLIKCSSSCIYLMASVLVCLVIRASIPGCSMPNLIPSIKTLRIHFLSLA